LNRRARRPFITAATTPELTIVETGRGTARGGETIGVKIDPAQLHLFDDATGYPHLNVKAAAAARPQP
jgi:hypothetical protein